MAEEQQSVKVPSVKLGTQGTSVRFLRLVLLELYGRPTLFCFLLPTTVSEFFTAATDVFAYGGLFLKAREAVTAWLMNWRKIIYSWSPSHKDPFCLYFVAITVP
ncbi:hypothetical protein V6N11_017066 [Hibiscus sabdariffa]|uniref:Uncharacterized protein n=1 Tax=Hibiscus sabdariffa TaxID=183260 RepID=A0ABR2TWY0_9ROSI